MRKAKTLFGLTVTMTILGIIEAISGFILLFALPSGIGRRSGENILFWNLSRHMWLDIHDWVAIALIIIVTGHIITHRTWIMRMLKHGIGISRGISQGECVPVIIDTKNTNERG